MTGLNLESFLHLLRADLGAWVSLGVIVVVLALMTWTSWGSHRALRKCLALSIVAHFGLVLYGSTFPIVLQALDPQGKTDAPRDRIRQIRVAPWSEADSSGPDAGPGRGGGRTEAFDRPRETLALAETKVTALSPDIPRPTPVRPSETEPATETATPDLPPLTPPEPEKRPDSAPAQEPTTPPSQAAPGDPNDIAAAVPKRAEPVPEAGLLPENNARLHTESGPAEPPRREPPTAAALPKLIAPAFTGPLEDRAQNANTLPAVPGPFGLADLKGQDVAAPAIVRGGPSARGGLLPDADLRARGRPVVGGLGNGFATPSRTLAPRPMLSAGVDPFGIGSARLSDLPRALEPTAAEAPATINAADPAAAGVAPGVMTHAAGPLPRMSLPDPDIRRPSRPSAGVPALASPRRDTDNVGPLALARVTPSGVGRLPDVSGTTGGRPLADIPEVYRSRLDPNRATLAQRAGASPESEQAVERALDWLKRHQDADGRWDAATARFDDGTVKKGDDDFTVHCPPGETCFGECLYWEADTALTGLALLAYLGAGYTHTDGKYAETIGKGIDFLIGEQKPNGDLRGPSVAVGMYCHSMATLALCEAYALSGDERLRAPVEKAVGFLTRARARDGMSWRYSPGEPIGDTSILGWAVMALKSAKLVGVTVPETFRSGTLAWLDRVSGGPHRGLASYLPGKTETPTMTAEAWVCRQFLGVGGPGPASVEAADYLLEHGPTRDPYNLYYWYYGTLAMYQYGGDAWYRWNGQVRDEIVRRQRTKGHQAGSWDPDDSLYGSTGGRIYCTALATLSLEVYYRFLRLYDDPQPTPPAVAPSEPSRRTLR